MSKGNKPPVLRLIQGGVPLKEPRDAVQGALFGHARPDAVYFYHVSYFQGRSFADWLEELSPRYVFDVRAVPNLDFWGLTRRQVLQRFADRGVGYIDAVGILDDRRDGGRVPTPQQVAELISSVAAPDEKAARWASPIAVLVDKQSMLARMADEVPPTLHPQPKAGFSVGCFSGGRDTLGALT